ncbi:MAG: terpene cyclase/mutase family protein [Gemmataceae bacterium]|nr:terpene cyclase/mutase family protein [Gemmataceae bacterium]MDW8265190.1 terpene cyclase/mutase family protein [Gemmataceae bacterium]
MMTTRRQFLAAAGGALLSAGHLVADTARSRLPDGSAAKGMITPATQRAIDQGLAYLAERQHADGSFGERQYHGNVAITSLAALAFMAGGSQPGRGPRGRLVLDALRFVLRQEERNRRGFLHNPQGSTHGPMYSHGFGTLFLGEVHGMVADRELRQQVRDTLDRAVKLIVATQNSEGGWRYQPERRDADISVTICQIMALRSARNAGLYVPKATVDECIKYVKACQTSDGGFRYMKQGGPPAFARTAAGVVALYSAGVYEGPEIERGLNFLMRYKPSQGMQREIVPDLHYFYGHYYAAQAMWTAGGDYWSEWYPAIREELVQRAGRHRADGAWFDSICSHYATAMACIILQIPNNYLPILQK